MLYLASASPRRIELLTQMGVRFEMLLAGADEDAEALEVQFPNETPLSYVKRVSLLKQSAAEKRLTKKALTSAFVLCADTTVALGRNIYGKPADAAEASCTLHTLSGRTHRVLTAVVVGQPGKAPLQAVSVSRVTFGQLSDALIERYVASGEPFGKAGAYAIQGGGGELVKSISGSASGIIGLPLWETRQLLNQAGYTQSHE